MLRGHSLGGSRKLNGHWQSGGGGMWGKWIIKDENATSTQNAVDEFIGVNDLFIKNSVIPRVMHDTRNTNLYKDCTWIRVKFTADTDLDFILFPQNVPTGTSSRWYGTGVQGKKIYSALEQTINSTVNDLPLVNISHGISSGDYLFSENPDCWYGSILKKDQSVTQDRLYIPLVSEDNTDLIDCYRVHQSMEVYVLLEWYGTTGILPDRLYTNRVMIYQMEAPGTMLIQATVTTWDEVKRNGIFYD